MVTETDIDKIFKKYSKGRITRSKAVRLYCKELCSAGDQKSWKECSFNGCFLWNFRLGREIRETPISFNKTPIQRVNITKKSITGSR